MTDVLRVAWLPMETAEDDATPIASALRAALTRFFQATPPGSLVLSAVVGTQGTQPASISLHLSTANRTRPQGPRLRDAVGVLAGLEPVTDVGPTNRGVRTWTLRPTRTGILPGTSATATGWPRSGFDWPAVLSCVERVRGLHSVSVIVTPVEIPEAAMPVLRRAVRRRIRNEARRDTATSADSSEDLLALLDELRLGACLTRVSVSATDEDSAWQAAACLLPAEDQAGVSVTLQSAGSPIVNGGDPAYSRLVNGEYVSLERAARMLPLVPLRAEHVTRFPRRPAPPVAWGTTDTAAPSVTLGTTPDGDAYRLPVADLTQHVIVTGLTGFGKSTTVMSLLVRLWQEHGIPFLVIDPEKEEYAGAVAALGAGGAEVSVLRLGRDGTRINPLAVPEGVDPAAFGAIVAEFVDAATRLSDSWPLAGSVLRNVVGALYADAAQDPPTIARLYRAIRIRTAAEPTSARQAAELSVSLGERIAALLSGPSALALAGGPRAGLDWGRLLRGPALISLAGYGDQTSRRLAFGLLLSGFVAYRRAHPEPGMAHLAVLEEAHMLTGSDAGPAAAAVAAALATLRGYGQGLALVTQTPGQLDRSVTDMFPNRISHRLTGAAATEAGFDHASADVQSQLPALDRGEALVVNAGSNPYPVLVRVTPDPSAQAPFPSRPPGDAITRGEDASEPIWCTHCPRPCQGRAMLPLVGEVRAKLLPVLRDRDRATEDVARQAVRAVAEVGAARRIPATNLATKLYCAAAKLLTAEFADIPHRSAYLTGPIRDAAEGYAARSSGSRTSRQEGSR